MDMTVVHNVENIERCKLKVVSMKHLEGNLNLALSTTPNNVLYLEDIGSYLSSKFETVGGEIQMFQQENHKHFQHIKTIKQQL